MLNNFLSIMSVSDAKTTGCSRYFSFDERLSRFERSADDRRGHLKRRKMQEGWLVLGCEGEPHPIIVPAV